MGAADATTQEILAQIPLFSLLDADERRTVAEHMNTRAFPKGHAIFTRGDVGDSLIDDKINLKAELEVAELQRRVDQIYEATQAHFAKLEKDGTR